ncbi:intradiol ring-cleavage dioxygenase [Qaidamihabitans albus]|uniref:intradiol ring-cleavage dioxygenase n=1 Tax=Qaidamihabitans albus TaxID=2795733 RepID=UPI0018F1E966|nr:intradiol ring-cleavage dioxygenase [Qaidamihabitans albus]
MTHEHHGHDRGLAFDLATLGRRRALLLFGGAGLAALAGCTSGSTGAPVSATTAETAAGCAEIPDETAGPFPGDGSNGPNVLTESGIVRSDIRSSFGAASGAAQGVPLTITLAVRDAASGCGPLPGAAVYLWHCDRDGEYSMYSRSVGDENYLRGVQETDEQGRVSFVSVFPGAYAGRWPHVHFEVYASLAEATAAGEPVKTSQLALPEDVCAAVYATDGYGQSVRNLAGISLEADNVFGDGWEAQLATVTGDAESGYTAELEVPV